MNGDPSLFSPKGRLAGAVLDSWRGLGMRLSATCLTLLLSLLVASTSIFSSVAQQPRVGEITLDPTHAVPGTLVGFQGIGWYVMPYPSIGPYFHCQVNGVPVKIDRHAICEVLLHEGIYEPAGTFVVADVPAGDYLIFINILEPTPSGALLNGETMFTVDPVATATSVATTTVVTLRTSTLATSAVPTVLTVTATVTTTKTESPSMPQAPDYTTILAPLSVVAIAVIVLLAVVVLRRRKKPSS